jgi:predicted dehydrogenase
MAKVGKHRAGIIGLSWISIQRPKPFCYPVLGSEPAFSHVAAYVADPRTEVVAVCDLSKAAVDAFRATWAVECPDARVYSDYKEMLSEEDLDIVSVVTSDHLHADMVVDAAESGVKGILCEKPLATTLADCDRMVAAVKARNVVMSINHTRRWMHEFGEARSLIDEGEIGEVRHVIATMGGPRALLFRNMTHMTDMVQFFVRSAPAWLVGHLEDGFDDYGPVYAGDGGHDPATDPGCNAYISFENGARAYLAGMKNTVVGSGYEIVGDKGTIRINSGEAKLWKAVEGGRMVSENIGRKHGSREAFEGVVSELVDAMESGTTVTSAPPDEARTTVAILLAILRSSHEKSTPIRL